MKRFDKGYIYVSLLTDFICSLFFGFFAFEEIFLGEDTDLAKITSALPFFAAIVAVIYLGFILYRVLYYRASGYELTEKEIRCKRGVFFRKRSLIEYRKIHAINKKQNLLHRLFGIALLTVDSGSANTSHQAEVVIIEKNETVDALLAELNALKEGGDRSATELEAKKEILLSEQDSLYRFTSKKKLLYSLINVASTACVVALLGILVIALLGASKLILQSAFLGTWGQYLLFAALILLGAMLLFSLFSLIGSALYSFVAYYGFTVTRQNDRLEISYGLLDKHTNTFRYDRIKAVKISQGIVQRLLGFATVRLEVIGYTVGDGDTKNAAGIGVLVPFCRYDEIPGILERVLPDYVPDKKQTAAVSFFPFVSWLLLFYGVILGVLTAGAIPCAVILGASLAEISAIELALLVLALFWLAFIMGNAVLAYRNNGVACNGKRITVYSGGFVRRITVFTSKSLTAVEDVTTPLRKKNGIASVVMHLKTNAGSNEIKVHIQKDTLSEELEKLLTL